MDAFATTADLEARWRSLSTSEQARAEVLLADASAVIASKMAARGVAVDESDEVQAANLKAIACAMVKRAMNVVDDGGNYTQTSMTAGPYSQSFTLANPGGDLYMTTDEQRRLGIARTQRCFSVEPMVRGTDD